MTLTFLPLLQVDGTNYEMGYQTGKHFATQIARILQANHKFQLIYANDKNNPAKADQVIRLIQENLPQFMDEIRGIAEGSSQEIRSIILLNLWHLYDEENCSTVIFKTPTKIFIGHNEDHCKSMCDDSYYLHMKLPDNTDIFSHSYPGCLPGFSNGFNSHGLVITCNSVPDPIKEIGIPRTFIGRWMLEATTIDEAVERAAKFVPRGGGVSYNIASLKEKRVVNLEITGNESALTEITERFFHSNHYISDTFSYVKIPSDDFSTSRIRYERGSELLPQFEMNEKGALKILWDEHVFMKHQIGPSNVVYMTLNTSIFEIAEEIQVKIYPRDRDGAKFDVFKF